MICCDDNEPPLFRIFGLNKIISGVENARLGSAATEKAGKRQRRIEKGKEREGEVLYVFLKGKYGVGEARNG